MDSETTQNNGEVTSTDGRGSLEKNEMSKGSKSSIQNGRWTSEEHARFIEALRLYGKDWNKVQEHIATRTSA